MKKFFIVFALVCFMAVPQAKASHGGEIAYVTIDGLVCDFCARAMEKVFGKREEVSMINVDLTTKVVTIEFKPGSTIDDTVIQELILDSGYNPVEIRRSMEHF